MMAGTFLPLHGVGNATPLDVRFAIAAVAGLIATLGMTVIMRLQSHGYVPAYVAAGALWRQPPERVSWSAANAVHLVAGMLAGVLFEGLVVVAERLREGLGVHVELLVAGLVTVSEILAVAIVGAFLYAFFAWGVFPRYGGTAYDTVAGTVRRQWAVSATGYVCLLLVVTVLFHRTLPV